jgi:conjugative transfer signal peptidase TraF
MEFIRWSEVFLPRSPGKPQLAGELFARMSIARSYAARPGPRGREIRFAALAIFLACLCAGLWYARSLHLGLNVTGSMPPGLYRMLPLDRPIVRDDMVVVCAPKDAAALGAERGYMPAGDCPHRTAPLLKFAAAVAGDVVTLTQTAVTVNGHRLPDSATATIDSRHRPLPALARGTYRLKPGQVWLWTPYAHGYDSRYYGPVTLASVRALAQLYLPIADEAFFQKWVWRS